MDNNRCKWRTRRLDCNIDIIMADFNSKYTGEQVENLLDQVANGEIGGGGIAVETDPVFSASPAASITEEKKAEWDNKVDKVSGKQLSTEDFTTILKTKLEGLSNYDDTELSEALSTLRGDFDKLVSGDTTTAIKTFNEIVAFLDGIEDSQDLEGIIASIEQQIAGKMDNVTLATVATSGSYEDLKNKPTIPSEQVNADWNATSGKAQILNKPTIPAAVTESTVSGWGFTKNTGTYSKPSGGIPKSDLASDVQTSLGKADNSLQVEKFQEMDIVTVNGIAGGNSGLVYALPNESIGEEDDVLLSRNTVKTINGKSIVGSGDITISGGSGEQGPQGDKGDKGDKGDTGVGVQSVAQTTTSNADGGSNIVTVTLTDGTKSTFTVKNGSKGSNGTNGTNGKDGADGEDGATFTPSVDSEGNLSWSNDKGLTNPPTVNIKGPKGDAGEGGGGSGGGMTYVEDATNTYTGVTIQANQIYAFRVPQTKGRIINFAALGAGQSSVLILPYKSGSMYLSHLTSGGLKWADDDPPVFEDGWTYEIQLLGYHITNTQPSAVALGCWGRYPTPYMSSSGNDND